MTRISDILNYFETFAPQSTAMDFDNVGLLAGSDDAVITRALVALDITADVVFEAKKLGCELIISHHPVIFTPIKKLASESAPYLLAQNGIAAVCMHTNLDLSCDFGVNTCLAEAVGVKNLKLCEDGECLFLGELEHETTIEQFALTVKEKLGCNGLRYTNVRKNIKRVAVSSGSGGSNAEFAAALGADVLLTGEIKHREINAANALNMDIIDAGHFKSEDVVILPLARRLSAQFSEIVFTKSKAYDDNIKFV